MRAGDFKPPLPMVLSASLTLGLRENKPMLTCVVWRLWPVGQRGAGLAGRGGSQIVELWDLAITGAGGQVAEEGLVVSARALESELSGQGDRHASRDRYAADAGEETE